MADVVNFLDKIKEDLDAHGVFDSLKNSDFTTIVLETTIPAYTMEFIGYSSTNVPVLNAPEDYIEAMKALGDLQRHLDRITYAYTSLLSTKNSLKELRSLAASHIQVNVNEVKVLKSKDLRDAAVIYVLKDFDQLISKVEEFYEIMAHTSININKAMYTIKGQIDLQSARLNLMNGPKLTQYS